MQLSMCMRSVWSHGLTDIVRFFGCIVTTRAARDNHFEMSSRKGDYKERNDMTRHDRDQLDKHTLIKLKRHHTKKESFEIERKGGCTFIQCFNMVIGTYVQLYYVSL